MKKHIKGPLLALLATALSTSLYAAGTDAGRQTSDADAAQYTLGLRIGEQLRQNGVGAAELAQIEQGVKDGMAGKHATVTDQMHVQAYLREASEALAAKNAAAAREFLARNAKTAGVETLPSGLQYKILEAGNAALASPGPYDMVTVDFRGTLLDGTEFDSSNKPGTTSTVQANGVMKGWTEALAHMKPGAKWRLFVPPELGFGPMGRMDVPGGSLLIYDMQLVNVAPPRVQPTAAIAPH